MSSGVTTMPEYLQKRFGGKRIQIFLAILYLFIYIFTKISVDMYAGALFIQQALHWDLYVAVIGLLIITAIYTVAGGLAAVIYTDTLQTVIMIIGALILMVYSFIEVGGYEALETKYFNAIPKSHTGNSTCGLPRDDAFHIFRDPLTSDLPWPGVLIGMTIPSLWYWCTDQVIVQRSLSAKNLAHAKGGSLLAAYLKVLPLFMMVFPGMISRVLFTDQVACADPELCKEICGNPSGCSDIAYPKMVIELLPTGLRGLMMSVMIAALMSSLTSIFNSASTIFTMDLWRHLRPRSREWELMIVGRVFVLVLVVVSILWIPLVQASQGGQLFIYIQSISSYLQPPVAVVFMAGCFWKRTNEKGAFWGLTIGLAVGVVRMILDFIYVPPQCDQPDTRPGVVKYVHYLYLSMILGLLTLIIVVVVSLCTDPPAKEMISRLTWFTRWDSQAETFEKTTDINATPNGEGANATPNGAGANTTANRAGANATPNGASANATPNGEGANATPNGASANATPNGAGANTTPNGEGANATPNGEGANATPNGEGANATPNGAGANATPNGEGANATPNGAGANATPNGAGANATPTGEGANATPNGGTMVETIPDKNDANSTDRIVNLLTDDAPSPTSRLKKAILWICGMDSKSKEADDQDPPAPQEPAEVLLHEPYGIKHLLNINLILCTSIAIFLWAYFG